MVALYAPNPADALPYDAVCEKCNGNGYLTGGYFDRLCTDCKGSGESDHDPRFYESSDGQDRYLVSSI